jgi:hypothetical protein
MKHIKKLHGLSLPLESFPELNPQGLNYGERQFCNLPPNEAELLFMASTGNGLGL